MVLVAQVYAPVEYDRTLYIFSCTKPLCIQSFKCWKVVRDQSLTISAAVAIPASDVVIPASQKKETVWDFSEISSTVADDGIDDLMQLLACRDSSLPSISKPITTKPNTINKPTKSVKSTNSADHAKAISLPSSQPARKALPSYAIDEEVEKWSRKMDAEDRRAASIVSKDRIQDLVENYLRDEEDFEHAEQLKQLGVLATTPKSNEGDDNADDDDEEILSVEDESDGAMRFNSSASAAYKIERYFQRRVAAYPKQILRYAYGGVPLWMSPYLRPLSVRVAADLSSASKKKSKSKVAVASSGTIDDIVVPPCPFCRSPRVFECQLMPGLLLAFPLTADVPDSVQSSTFPDEKRTTGDGSVHADMGDMKIDFGLVTVWSCPNSCPHPVGGLAEEYVIVQPPLDEL